MAPTKVRLIVESFADENFLSAIFYREIEAGTVGIQVAHGSGSGIAIVDRALREHPDRPIALILNTETRDRDEIAARRGTVNRILALVRNDRLHIAWAVPKLNAWVMTDPRIKADFLSRPSTKKNDQAQALRIKELVPDHPFDPTNLRKKFEEYRDLESFLKRFSSSACVKSKV